MKIISSEKIYALDNSTAQIRVKIFNQVVFRFSFKATLNPI